MMIAILNQWKATLALNMRSTHHSNLVHYQIILRLVLLDVSPSDIKMDISSYKHSSSNVKVSRPKPPIKSREKLPNVTNAVSNQPQTLQSPHNESTMTTMPSLLTPKSAPSKPLLRTASTNNYDHLENYECIHTTDQKCSNRILWVSASNETAPVQYYNVLSTFSCSAVVHNAEKHEVECYEKIQTYETIPYHFSLTTKVSELK